MINVIMDGEWDKVASMSWDLFTGYTPKGFILGKIVDNITDLENVAQAMDIAGNTANTAVLMASAVTNGGFYDAKNGFTKSNCEMESYIRAEMNRLDYSKQEKAKKKTLNLNDPIGGVQVAAALNATQTTLQIMQSLARPQGINNNQRTEVVINGGVNVHSSASTITGTAQDAVNGIETSMAGLQFNTVSVMEKTCFTVALIALFSLNAFANEPFLDCQTTKGKRLKLEQIGDEYVYTFGTDKKVELSFRNKISKVKVITPEDSDFTGPFLQTTLFMKNGDYTYAVYNAIDRTAPDSNDPLSRNESGVHVYKGENKMITSVLCEKANKLTTESHKVYQSGTYKVGTDILAGEYKVVATSSDKTGMLFVSSTANYRQSVVHHEIFTNQTYVTVKDG